MSNVTPIRKVAPESLVLAALDQRLNSIETALVELVDAAYAARPVELLTIAQVSELTKVPVETLKYWRKGNDHGLPSRNLGGIKYRRADVEAWIRAQFDGSESVGTA